MKKTTLLKTLILFGLLIVNSMISATTVSHTFSATSGSIDSNISFTTQKNSSQTTPAFNTQLRLYYSSTGDGCSITLTPANGAIITDVTLTAVATYTPTVKYNVNGGGDLTASLSTTTYSMTGMSASSSLKIRNGNTTNTQLRVTGISVTYSIVEKPVVSAASLTGTVGVPFSYQISATNNPTGYAVASGTLPDGLTLNSTTGEISGTPTTAGSPSVTVTATNGGGTSDPVALDFTIAAGVGQSQTITFGSLASKTYGDASFGLSATASSGLAVTYASSNTDVATVSGSTVTIVGAGSTNITASQAGNGTYNPAVAVVQPLTVNAKELTIGGAAVTTKSYTGTNAAVITGSLVGVINSDDVSFVGVGVFTDVNVGVGIPVTSNCSLSGTKAMNYVLTQPSGLTGEITKASQTITFGVLADKTSGDSPFLLSASASSALTVSYSSSNTAVATVSGNTVTIVGVGATIITASQDGNSNYEAATPVERTLNVDLPAPVATSATGLQGVDALSNSFVANWNAVSGATTYQVNVYTKTGGGGSSSVLTEDFNGFTGGATGSGAAATDVSTSMDSKTSVAGWTGVKVYEAGGAIKMGTSSSLGYIVTPALNLSAYSGAFNVSFKSMAWSGDSTKLKIYLDNVLVKTVSGLNNDASYTLSSFSVDLTGGTAASVIKFEGNQAAKGRFFLEDLEISQQNPLVETPIAGSPFAVTDGTQLAVSNLPVGVYYYTVSATNGVQTSSNSNEISVTIDVATDLNKLSSAMKVRVVGGRLFVTGVSEYSVYNSQGVEICKMNSDKSDNSVALRPGIYVVRAGAKTQKVIVK